MKHSAEAQRKGPGLQGTWVGLLAAALIVGAPCHAEDRAPDPRMGAVVAPAMPLACEQASPPEMQHAVERARATLDALWLKTKSGYFAAYTLPGMKRNPFDLTPLPPNSGPRDGIVQAREPSCTIEPAGVEQRHIVRFRAPFYRFFEKEAKWSRPLRDGLMMEVEVTRSSDIVNVRDVWAEAAILQRDQRARRPDEQELSRLDRWAEPVPGCKRTEKWNGNACTSRRK